VAVFATIKAPIEIVFAGFFFNSGYRFFTISKPADRFAIAKPWHLITSLFMYFMISLFIDF